MGACSAAQTEDVNDELAQTIFANHAWRGNRNVDNRNHATRDHPYSDSRSGNRWKSELQLNGFCNRVTVGNR
jgi:hypothetical protein